MAAARAAVAVVAGAAGAGAGEGAREASRAAAAVILMVPALLVRAVALVVDAGAVGVLEAEADRRMPVPTRNTMRGVPERLPGDADGQTKR